MGRVIWDDEVRDESGRIVEQADDKLPPKKSDPQPDKKGDVCPHCGAKWVHTQFCKYLGKVRVP